MVTVGIEGLKVCRNLGLGNLVDGDPGLGRGEAVSLRSGQSHLLHVRSLPFIQGKMLGCSESELKREVYLHC